MRFIDVVTSSATIRSIQSYESTLEISVRSKRSNACFDHSLKLRERAVAALKNVGLAESEIKEGGGNVGHNLWADTNSVMHSIIVRNDDMAKLMQAMAAIERLFAELRPSIFSTIKQSFSFAPPKPIFAPSISGEEALANAMDRARKTAEAIAAAHGVQIEAIVSVFEISAASQQSPPGHDEMDSQSSYLDLGDADEVDVEASYAALGQPTGRGTRRFRVRFSVKA